MYIRSVNQFIFNKISLQFLNQVRNYQRNEFIVWTRLGEENDISIKMKHPMTTNLDVKFIKLKHNSNFFYSKQLNSRKLVKIINTNLQSLVQRAKDNTIQQGIQNT